MIKNQNYFNCVSSLTKFASFFWSVKSKNYTISTLIVTFISKYLSSLTMTKIISIHTYVHWP